MSEGMSIEGQKGSVDIVNKILLDSRENLPGRLHCK